MVDLDYDRFLSGESDPESRSFDLTEFLEAGGWDAGKVCALSDEGAQQIIAMWVVEAEKAHGMEEYSSAKHCATQALRVLKEETEAGRTKQAERAARAAEEEIG